MQATNLRDVLCYDRETGLFTWRVNRRKHRAGSRAGVLHQGYIRIKSSGITYAAHRLAWLFVHGKWPTDQIDHINQDRSDNRICNLRESTQSENMCNRGRVKLHGFKGVHRTPHGRYQAQARLRSVSHYLGTFGTAEEAFAAYSAFARQHHRQFVNLQNERNHSMARSKSVVLSKDEKKALTTTLKATVKTASAAAKDADKAIKAAEKAHTANMKALTKAKAAADKAAADAAAKLAAVVAPA